MTNGERDTILRHWDWERQNVVYPGVTRQAEMGLVRDMSADGKSGVIIFSSCLEDQLDEIIETQIALAQAGRYELEWKLYSHDRPECLAERLKAAGFVPGDREAFLVMPLDQAALDCFGESWADTRQVTNEDGLRDVRVIYEEALGPGFEALFERHRYLLEHHPSNLSVYVAYHDGEPASCGRVYFHEESRFAGLYGGTTRERFRRRGLFTQIVAARLREAVHRGVSYVCVDALPTSQPILLKRGFEVAAYTQPFCSTPED